MRDVNLLLGICVAILKGALTLDLFWQYGPYFILQIMI